MDWQAVTRSLCEGLPEFDIKTAALDYVNGARAAAVASKESEASLTLQNLRVLVDLMVDDVVKELPDSTLPRAPRVSRLLRDCLEVVGVRLDSSGHTVCGCGYVIVSAVPSCAAFVTDCLEVVGQRWSHCVRLWLCERLCCVVVRAGDAARKADTDARRLLRRHCFDAMKEHIRRVCTGVGVESTGS